MALTAALGRRGAEQDRDGGGSNGGNGNGGGEARMIMREHMFDKVVTPSDVGKLNRLVVPKHFAERHLLPRVPGGAAGAACPGAVLRFEDGRGGGKAWAFRFSYWSSSQSYVITKGWSAFVRDRRLAAGDTVSFCRAGARLFIDCRRRGAGVVSGVHEPKLHRIFSVVSAPTTSLLVPVALPQQAMSDEDRAPRGRRLRLFGVDLELAGAE